MPSASAHLLANRTPGLYRPNGVWKPRRMLWALDRGSLQCPDRHEIQQNGFVTSHTGLRCNEWIGTRQCGALIWVKAIPTEARKDEEPDYPRCAFWYADVTSAELLMFRAERLTSDDILRYLGAAL